MEGPEYPGEGAINIFYSRAYLVSALGTKTKKIKMMAKCSSNTTKKNEYGHKPSSKLWRESGDWVALLIIIAGGPLK